MIAYIILYLFVGYLIMSFVKNRYKLKLLDFASGVVVWPPCFLLILMVELLFLPYNQISLIEPKMAK